MNAALSKEVILSHKAIGFCNLIFPARAAASLRCCVHNVRVGLFFLGGKSALAVVCVFAAASVSLFGCAEHCTALTAQRPPNFTAPNPDVPKFYTTHETMGLAGGPSISEPGDVREPAGAGEKL